MMHGQKNMKFSQCTVRKIAISSKKNPKNFTTKYCKPARCLTSRDRKISNKKKNQIHEIC